MDRVFRFFGKCEECEKWKVEKAAMLEVRKHQVPQFDGLHHISFEIFKKIAKLEKTVETLKIGNEPVPRKKPTPNEAGSQLEGWRQSYAAKKSFFSAELGYDQVRGHSSQDDVDVVVNRLKLKVAGSRGHGCLGCSMSFHLHTWLRPDKLLDRYNPVKIDEITMKGEKTNC